MSPLIPRVVRNGLTRRGFLKGAGVAAAGAVLADELQSIAAEAPETGRILGPGAIPITLKVNGQDKRLDVEPRTTLAEALRVKIDLTGTKVVCDRGACSACTIWVNHV